MNEDCNNANGLISEVIITDGKEFRQYTYDIPKEERIIHSTSIPVTFTACKPDRPYWEHLGYESEKQMYSKSHLHVKTKDGDFCMTCNSDLNNCSLAKK